MKEGACVLAEGCILSSLPVRRLSVVAPVKALLLSANPTVPFSARYEVLYGNGHRD